MTTTQEIQQRRQLTLDSMVRTGPEHFDMGAWFHDDSRPGKFHFLNEPVDLTTCGTTACLAGHAVLANEIRATRPADVAAYLDVPRDLFFWSGWPGYAKAPAYADEFKVACQLMDWFAKHPERSDFPTPYEWEVHIEPAPTHLPFRVPAPFSMQMFELVPVEQAESVEQAEYDNRVITPAELKMMDEYAGAGY